MEVPSSLEYEQFFTQVTTLIREYLIKYSDRDAKVVDFKKPDELKQLMDFDLRDAGESTDTIYQQIQKMLDYSVHTAHPRFYNQLFAGVDEIGMLGLFLSAATNTSMYTFEMAPVFSLMEGEVLRKMRELVGWHHGDGDGIFSPGGSISNLYGLMAARYHRFQDTKLKGVLGLPQMVIFASEQSHYSTLKASIIMGIGTEHVILIKCNKQGKMIPEDLEAKISEAKGKGLCPMAVVATAGTTVLGAFDPLSEIADICQKCSIWLHVDAAFGGSALLSRTHRKLLTGIERADSVTWNPHKSMGAPQQCSTILLRHKGLLADCNSAKADYLFQQDKVNYDVSYDTGDKSIQCGRVNDVLKVWMMWKIKGTSGFEQQIDHAIAVAQYLAEQIRKREGFELVIENPEYTNVPFWYLPLSLRSCTDAGERKRRLNKVAPMLKSGMVKKGSMMMNYQPLPRDERPNFLRMTLITPKTCEADMDFVLDEIERLGKDLDV